MNPIRKMPLHMLMLAGLLASAEAPAADGAAGKAEAKAEAKAANPDAKLQAYAGINVSSYSGYQREREPAAAVPEGIGLIVGFLDPEGPAVGKLQEKDVLTRLDDQVLVNAEQFRALLQTRKPGDTVRLVRVRGDDVDTVEIKLAGKAAPKAMVARAARASEADPSSPPTGASGIRIMVNGQEVDPGQMVAGGTLQLGPGGQGNIIVIDPHSPQMPPDARKMLEDMRQRGLPVPPDMADPDPSAAGAQRVIVSKSFSFGTGTGATSSSMYSDGDGTVQVRKESDKKFATVKDADGKVLFDGEITSEDQLKGLSDAVRSRIALADGNGLRIPGMPKVEPVKPADGAGEAKATSAKRKPKRDPHEGA